MKVEPVDILKRAVAAIEEASVPEDLRTLAFARVLDILVNTPSTPSGTISEEKADDSDIGETGSDLISRIAEKVSIPVTRIDRVFDERDGELIFSGNLSALGKSKAEKVHAIVLLLLAGRRWAGLDGGSTTPDEVLRSEVESHGLLDTTNYTKHVATLKPYVTITGSGRRATYKIKYDGLEKAKEIVRSLATPE